MVGVIGRLALRFAWLLGALVVWFGFDLWCLLIVFVFGTG